MGLRLRLFLVLIVPLTLMVGVYGMLRARQESAQLLDEERRRVTMTARAVTIAVENALRDRRMGDVQPLLSEIAVAQEQIEAIRIFDRSLALILASGSHRGDGAGDEERRRRVIATGGPAAVTERGSPPDRFLYVAPLKSQHDEVLGAIEMRFRARGMAARMWEATRDTALRLGALTLALWVLTAVALQRQVLRPLSRLTQSIRAVGEGALGPPLAVRRRDELGAVAEAFNGMTEQLAAARHRLVAENERTLELERQLRHAATLAVAGKLASGIAHEVGTPLNIISGRAEILLRALPSTHPGRSDLEVIIGQTDRISAIIRSLLDTVRMQKPSIQRVSLTELVGHLLQLLDHTARRRGVGLATDLPDALPGVAGDPGQLQQVFLNLLVNAIEATPRGGRVAVAARASGNDGRTGVAVSVSDTGSGIPAHALSKVFDAFYTTKPAGQGTGLGLAISRDIVREHGGTLAVQSRDGAGSTFTVWLPDHEEAR
jgi:two-component system, NtrC family, sensor kinase